MGKNIKETLLGTLVHGKEVLNNIEVLRRTSKDPISDKNYLQAADNLHVDLLSLKVNEIIDISKDARIIRFVSTNDYLPPFEAGQYINVFTEIDGVRTSRPYSISSSPRQRAYYEITVARIKDGFVSTYLLEKLKVGDILEAKGPCGVFHYNPVFHSPKSLFLAGGSGVTPFMSMLREILEASLDRDIVMLYGCRNAKVALYHQELEKLSATYPNFKYYLVISDKDPKYKGESGLLSKELIMKLVPDVKERTAYICGPRIMNEYCTHELEDLGLKTKQIRHEMFGGKRNVLEEPGWPTSLKGTEEFKISIKGHKDIIAKANEPILVALEKAGIRVNVCCRSGECSLCRVKLVKGKVFLAKGVLLRYADEKFGYIHSCQAYPISNITIEL